MSFLKAEWRKLAIFNYLIDKEVLEPYLPAGTQLDLWNGKCFVSVIGFMFLNTKLLGIRIPFHTNFEEVNLRFYVKRMENGASKRGVVFIKEIVPKIALALVANTFYNESYETLPMKHYWSSTSNSRFVEYKWKKNNKWNSIKIEANLNKDKIEAASEEEFITEHYWGYAKVSQHRSNEYEVSHPKWEVYQVKDFEIDVDFSAVYGSAFGVLNSIRPHSVMLAEGSEITVEKKRVIENKT